ncbi:MAG TPA: energy-coupling factor transporter ATPase [Candidatus Anaerobutyricum faecale]|uniref:energy-coupling factor transporter ATPase n=1 Tax=Eubacterium sp. An11 TaxID=1965542 RepID=UPI000B3AED20|nr:energy-coupling factor transporter ATPase [Eubacterium sp. An11]OUQ66802.1 energy-coupling factor transporter ATPase [Eubacterium sp. An11]HJC30726.1 energy-coupling factor transporter ATPase [Candidatus Anaerobutyricum faecale]
MKIIETLNLIFKYRTYTEDQEIPEEKTVLDDVSISIKKGNFVGILGHNGSGKSTLARQLTALLQPTDGAVFIKNMDSSLPENIIPIRKTAGMVFQNPDNQIIGNLVEEDVAFGPENLGVPTEQIWGRIAEALEATGMTAYREQSPGSLSGGQKQKVAIAGILAMEPECIVFDEPTAMLDPRGRKEVLDAIWHLNKDKGITVIYITHHIEEVENADYIYVMNKGQVAMEGRPEELWPQTETLKSLGISLPFDKELLLLLRQGGMEIPARIQTGEALAEYLTAFGAGKY